MPSHSSLPPRRLTLSADCLESGDGGKQASKERNKKGNELKSVPSKVKKTEVHQQLKLMTEYLTEHARDMESVRARFGMT